MDILKETNPDRAVCFSGHRPDRLPGRGDPGAAETRKLTDALREQIKGAVGRGKDTFINGLMAGWDYEKLRVMRSEMKESA